MDLSALDEVALLEGLSHAKAHPSGHDLLEGREAPGRTYVVLSGIVCRYALLPDGRRQIIAYFVAGDMVELGASNLERLAHGICTLSPCRLAFISDFTRQAWKVSSPCIDQAILHAMQIDASVTVQWLVNLGARQMDQRIAHLLLELRYRLHNVGRAPGNTYSLPITQGDIAETVGGSVVHVSRTLGILRKLGLASFRRGEVVIGDLQGLTTLSGFDDCYLHLGDDRQLSRSERVNGRT